MRRLIQGLAGIGLAWLAGPALPDVDDSTYDTRSERLSPAARRALDAQIARDRQLEEERQRREREEAAREEAARQAALAARPYPVRLLEQRCNSCHAAGLYLGPSHTLPGWWFVNLRMKYLHEAELEAAEMRVLAAYLTEIRPAAGAKAALEYAALSGSLAVPIAAWWWLRRVRRRRRAERE